MTKGIDLSYFKEMLKERSFADFREHEKMIGNAESILSSEIEEFYLQIVRPEDGDEFEEHSCLYFFDKETCLIAKYVDEKYFYTSIPRETIKKELVYGTYDTDPLLRLFFDNGSEIVLSWGDAPNLNWRKDYFEHLLHLFKVI